MFTRQTVSRPQNTLLRCRALSLLRVDNQLSQWGTTGWLFLKGEGLYTGKRVITNFLLTLTKFELWCLTRIYRDIMFRVL